MNDFWPTSTKDKLYIPGEISFGELYQRIQEHFSDGDKMIFIEDFTMHTENIHTHAIGCDLNFPCDYTTFLIITRKT